MFDAKFCENICIGLKVMLKKHFFRTFSLDCEFQSDLKEIFAVVYFKVFFNINLKHSRSVKAC